ncbi:MAG TPA: VOC family protein [Gammaproteobacteria bacterium]|nr:VOC family protein [Gammaproteobacteria bacterium]
MTQPLQTVRQLAYVVRDLDAALHYWTTELKAGPFFLFEHCALLNQRFHGRPSNVDVSLAIGNSGDLQIELIQQHNDEPSVYKEFLDAGRVGVHHFGLMPVDYAAACAHYRELGYAAAFECTVGGAPLSYFDTVKTLGHYTELWDNSPVYKDLFLMVENAAKGWDGKDPVRKMAL